METVSQKSRLQPPVDAEGYLLNPEDWDERLVPDIARREGVALNDEVWRWIRYFRSYYEDHGVHPTMHKLLREELGRGRHFHDMEGLRDHLHRLFPRAPVPTLCKLAGLPAPVGDIEE